MNVLVVAAHPDDELLGVGGTLIRHLKSGDNVHVIILGEGVTARSETRDSAPAGSVLQLQQQAKQVADMLGYASNLHMLGLPDNRFDQLSLLDIIKKIEYIGKSLNPHTVYTHYWGDINIDHAIASRAVQTAFRPTPGQSVKRILCFESVSATAWSMRSDVFTPTVYIDIHATLAMKLDALGLYKDEMQAFPHARSLEAIKAKAVSRGSEAGMQAAEAFMLVRELIE